jgi:hypothetical protein
MQIAHHFFENGMAFFTEMIQIGISMTVALGCCESHGSCVRA